MPACSSSSTRSSRARRRRTGWSMGSRQRTRDGIRCPCSCRALCPDDREAGDGNCREAGDGRRETGSGTLGRPLSRLRRSSSRVPVPAVPVSRFPLPASRSSRRNVKNVMTAAVHPLERDIARSRYGARSARLLLAYHQRHMVESIRRRRVFAYRDDHVIGPGRRRNRRDRRARAARERQRVEPVGVADLVLEVAGQRPACTVLPRRC